MPGEAYALICAFLWALSSTLVKSQTHKMHVVVLGALRTVPALILYWAILLVSGRADEPFRLSSRVWALFAGSTLVGLVVGDTIYFQSMKLIGLSRAMPLSTTYPFFTMLLALVFLDEALTWAVFAGALLIVVGAYLLAVPKLAGRGQGIEHAQSVQSMNPLGVGLALAAALCWAVSTIMVREALSTVDVAVANSVRLSILAIALFGLSLRQGGIGRLEVYGFRTLFVVFLAGVIGMGLGTYTFLSAVQRAGAARASVLTASTPLFGVPLAILLKEKVSARALVGTVLTVAGVVLTVYQ